MLVGIHGFFICLFLTILTSGATILRGRTRRMHQSQVRHMRLERSLRVRSGTSHCHLFFGRLPVMVLISAAADLQTYGLVLT